MDSNDLGSQTENCLSLEVINGIKFTSREVDVLCCLHEGWSNKKIAAILLLSPKAVANYIYNITQKLNCNSRESVRDFLENSDKVNDLKRYYNNLRLRNTFEEQLKSVSTQTCRESLVCSLILWREDNLIPSLFYQLEDHLKLSGIGVIKEPLKGRCSISSLTEQIDKCQQNYALYLIPQYLQQHLIKTQNLGSLKISWIPDDESAIEDPSTLLFLRSQDGQKSLSLLNFPTMALKDRVSYYLSFIKILTLIFPKLSWEDFRLKLKHTNLTSPSLKHSTPPISEEPIKHSRHFLKDNFVKGLLQKKKRFTIITILFLIITGGAYWVSNIRYDTQQPEAVALIDLPLPSHSSFLDRPELITEIDKNFNDKAGIQIVALIGTKGAGKTTLARQYAHQQRAEIIWEVDAETRDTLAASFEEIIQVLVKTEEEKKILIDIRETTNPLEKEVKILKFIKNRLKTHQNWFLIYDNVDKLSDIITYLPRDFETWGVGKVLLTTRNISIQNNQHVNNIVQIGELTSSQKLILFTKIISRGNSEVFTAEQIAEIVYFLEKIFPSPLDISLAAYYLNATHVTYATYLQNLSKNSKEFEETQAIILKEAGEYNKRDLSASPHFVRVQGKINKNR